MPSVHILLISLLMTSCNSGQDPVQPTDCADINLNKNLKYEDIIGSIYPEFLLQTTEQPDGNGALSRNKDGYFSVRFQINIPKLTDVAIALERPDALVEYSKALAYAFDHQNPDGSYELIPPEELMNPPTRGDSVSAIAFFGYALSISLNALDNSGWYKNNDEIAEIKSDIGSYKQHIDKTLTFLMENESILRQVDAEAPNRLLFNAIAIYGLGKYTGNTDAQSLAMEFLNHALSLTSKEEGYFIEGGGWDSSYNGVAVKLGLELFTMLPSDHPTKDLLGNHLTCATKWQETRILASGEISTEGNTRVYPGGESFLGKEKGVDVEKTVRAFYYFSVLTGEKEYQELADRILDYYQ